ncbi:hypothetical protein [Denitrificimonas caeni]|uniref:Uncharacterized protein n=1 Tax=Denitrificimonas caeni TaxID=521720 RepID=A0AAE9VPC8_9GAMM|nr:hypothetical protein [Denitrificimonas caeni]WBE25067.1 hypothetical protein O6P33_12015 [Denitrificimonas caeni]
MRDINKYSDYINEVYLYFELRNKNLLSPLKTAVNLVFWWFFFVPVCFFLFFIYFFILTLIPRRFSHNKNSKVCIARTFATRNKLRFLEKESVVFYKESAFIFSEDNNLYNFHIGFRLRIFLYAFNVFVTDSYKLGFELSSRLDVCAMIRAIGFYIVRFPHKVAFHSYFNFFVKVTSPEIIITGNKEDRFALVEQTVSKKNNVKLICYPHGLEYGVTLPRGVVGDRFYCYSEKTASIYKSIYKATGQEFIFDFKVVKSLLGKSIIKPVSVKPKVVFFPESRGIDVNRKIISILMASKINFYLKLHPLDKFNNYVECGVEESQLIKDFDDAIVGNIVIARKSTVLLEAVYSGSTSCAVLFDSQDMQDFKTQFPSLSDERIMQVKNIAELLEWLVPEESHPE